VRRDSQDKNTQDMLKRSEGVISSPERRETPKRQQAKHKQDRQRKE
jgi:hypothetical protein